MKKILFLFCAMLFCCFRSVAQFEGEYTSKIYQNYKSDASGVGSKLLNAITSKSTNKRINKGIYTMQEVVKGNKRKLITASDNKVTIYVVESDYEETTEYYTDIKKGYRITNPTGSKKSAASNAEISKYGSATISGHKCDLYKVRLVRMTMENDGMSLVSTYDIAIDPTMQVAEDMIIPGTGLNGFAYKSVHTLESKQQDYTSYNVISTMVTSIKERTVDDSEFEVPSDIQIVGILNMNKVMKEHEKYMQKNPVPPDPKFDENKVYDNLEEDWDY